jgi:glyoxylase-like metal-dependent hydrolase (beta-lactamase superfamily II)
MRLSDRVYLTLSGDSGCSLSHPRDCNAYAIDCGDEVFLIDAGVGRETDQIVSNLERDGIASNRISTLLLTHAHLDHSGGAYWLYENLGVNIIASVETAATMKSGDETAISLPAAKRAGVYDDDMVLRACPVARALNGGEQWTQGDATIHAVRSPGHSLDMMSFFFQTSTALLAFTGDTVFHEGAIAVQNIPDCIPSDYARSLRELATWPIDGFFPGHGIWSVARGSAQVRKSLPYLDRLLLPPNAF